MPGRDARRGEPECERDEQDRASRFEEFREDVDGRDLFDEPCIGTQPWDPDGPRHDVEPDKRELDRAAQSIQARLRAATSISGPLGSMALGTLRFDGFIRKPFRVKDLLEGVERVLARKE